MLALSIRQPYAELILRGEKTIEYRSRPTRMIGQRFYIYAARKWAGFDTKGLGVRDQGSADDEPNTASPHHPLISSPTHALPTGVIVGSAVIDKCVEVRNQKSEVSHNGTNGHLTSDLCPLTSALYEWHLSDVKRWKRPRAPRRRPQPVWFKPF